MSHDSPSYWDQISQRRQEILNVRQELERRQRPWGRLVFRLGLVLAHPAFFLALLVLHGLWLLANLRGVWPWQPWDPSPFPILAMIASVEAPFLALLILMRQEHDRRIAELRDETQLQLSLHADRGDAANTRLLAVIAQRLGIDPEAELERGEDLDQLTHPLDPQRLVEEVSEEMEKAGEGPD